MSPSCNTTASSSSRARNCGSCVSDVEILVQRDSRCVRGIALTFMQGLGRGMPVNGSGGASEGKTVLLTEMIHCPIGRMEDVSMRGGIVERTRDGEELPQEMTAAGVLSIMR